MLTFLLMGTFFLILIALSALMAFAAFIAAARAGLRMRRTQREFSGRMTAEIDRLSARTERLQAGVETLSSRSQKLPVQIAELQVSMARLQILTGALNDSVQQVQRAVSYARPRSLGAERIAGVIGTYQKRAASRVRRSRRERRGQGSTDTS